MGKRKERKDPERPGAQDGESSDEDMDMLDVDFEFFDPQPNVDFHGLKTLLRQLLDVDAQLFDMSALADLILAQPLLGSTVKVDGNESDPFAFLTVINLNEHRSKPAVNDVIQYLSQKCSSISGLEGFSKSLLAPTEAQVGLLLTERFINMPAEVVPPMYKMLLEEISWALEEKEPYQFTHYLILSKTYKEVESKLDLEDSRPQKKKRKDGDDLEVFYFHPEDELLHKYAVSYGNYDYTEQGGEGASDSKRTFQEMGVSPQGHLILIEAGKLKEAIEALEKYIQPTA